MTARQPAPFADKKPGSTAISRPVTILHKPRPVYTAQARAARIEGEVVFRALFTAAGAIRVLEIMEGLGHGLDESAVQAATAIRFRPAESNGEPVDSIAVVHISFQLAY